MNTLEAILTRRSIRKYKNEKVPVDKINELLKAAMYAPSAFNLQPWEFIVIDDKNILGNIVKVVPYAEMLNQASHAILVCGDNEKEKNTDFLIQDCSAATQNILLAAHDAGLGACWIAACGMNDTIEVLNKFFNLPGNIIPVALISIGYPDESPSTEERFVKEKVHRGTWV